MDDLQEYTMPKELTQIIKPMPADLIRLITLKQLNTQAYWVRPVISGGKASACPCCGAVHPMAAHGVCGGCYNPTIKTGLFGPALLGHLARRAKYGKKIRPTGPKVIGIRKEYAMEPALASVLRPMSQAEAETATIAGLAKFWIRPLIKYKAKSACPCCGGVHRLRNYGLCSGCASDKVAKLNLTGLPLLEHLSRRAEAVREPMTGQKVNEFITEKSISQAHESSSPAATPLAGAGQVESFVPDPILHALGMPPFGCFSVAEVKSAIDDLIKQRDRLIESNHMLEEQLADVAKALCAGEDDNLPLIALRMMEQGRDDAARVDRLVAELADLNKLLAGEPYTASSEESIVEKWSALPVPSGYEALTSVLEEAIFQAAKGKGMERHADGRPFHDQPILRETQAVGLGFPAGQARKKIMEAVRCCDNHPDRAIADLLGAINYTAAVVIAIRAMMVEQAA